MTKRSKIVLPSRRGFFASAAGAGLLPAALHSTATPGNAAEVGGSLPYGERMEQAYAMRVQLAERYRKMPAPQHPTNGDEQRYGNLINTFTKTLRHNAIGEVLPDSYTSMTKALLSGKESDFDAILRGGSVRLKNPMAAFTYQLSGADPAQFTMRAAPAFESAEQAGEMTELYWMALTRDVPFTQYGSDPVIAQACADLSRLSDFRAPREEGRITPGTIFRGTYPGETVGPFVSQLLLKTIPLGSYDVEQKQRPAKAGLEFMTTPTDWLSIQLGQGKGEGETLEETPRHIRTLRDLAHYVHHDYSYSPAYGALWILLHYGDPAMSGDNPYLWSPSQDAFATFGPVDGLDYIARAAKAAFNAAWYQKWMVHQRARPEVFSGRVHYHLAQRAVYPIPEELLRSPVLDAIGQKYGSYLLPQAYSEGSPAHSAYPSGHATVNGACITMMKAFFREDMEFPDPVTLSADGTRLVPWGGAPLTVGGELNKLASNIATARNAAGIHWRTDGSEGLKLGEDVAIHILREMAACYAEDFGGFTFTKFDGTKITVCGNCA